MDKEENIIPRFLVPLTYLIAYLAAQIWAGSGLWQCWLRRDVIVARSGRVELVSHKSEPTRLYIVCFRDGEARLSLGGRGIESTGCPERYGVVVGLASVRLAMEIRLSANDSWESMVVIWLLGCRVQVNFIPRKCVTSPIKSTLVRSQSLFSKLISR